MEIYPITTNARDEIAEWKKKAKPIIFQKLPFCAMIYGSSGTGKSTFVANVFLRNFDGLMDAFLPKNIYIFAQNAKSDASFRALIMNLKKLDPEWDNYSDAVDTVKIAGLIQKNKTRFEETPPDRQKLKY